MCASGFLAVLVGAVITLSQTLHLTPAVAPSLEHVAATALISTSVCPLAATYNSPSASVNAL